MANIRKGLKRIIWILSIGTSISAWIIIFLTADLEPVRNINKEGVSFIKWLDGHYFEDSSGGLKLSEFTRPGMDTKKFEDIKAAIEKSVKGDSLDRWPFAWEWFPRKNETNGFDIDREIARIRWQGWQERIRKALLTNEQEIKRTFPDIKFDGLSVRYGLANNPNKLLSSRDVLPESFFMVRYQRPYGHLAILFLLGFAPFITIWLLWFLVSWVVYGFKN